MVLRFGRSARVLNIPYFDIFLQISSIKYFYFWVVGDTSAASDAHSWPTPDRRYCVFLIMAPHPVGL